MEYSHVSENWMFNGKCYSPKTMVLVLSCHRRFQEWIQLDIFDKLWTRLLNKYFIYDKKERNQMELAVTMTV